MARDHYVPQVHLRKVVGSGGARDIEATQSPRRCAEPAI